jgi:low temperature requirement protein LtrA
VTSEPPPSGILPPPGTLPPLLGVVGLAAGVKLTIGHAAQPHPAAQALAIGGGVALFLAGHAAGWPRCSPSSAAGGISALSAAQKRRPAAPNPPQ